MQKILINTPEYSMYVCKKKKMTFLFLVLQSNALHQFNSFCYYYPKDAQLCLFQLKEIK